MSQTNDFLNELNPIQKRIVQSVGFILTTQFKVFIETGVSKDPTGELVLYAVPRWVFKDVLDKMEIKPDLFTYTVKIPHEKHVLNAHEADEVSVQISQELLKTYLMMGREIAVEYDYEEVNKSILKTKERANKNAEEKETEKEKSSNDS